MALTCLLVRTNSLPLILQTPLLCFRRSSAAVVVSLDDRCTLALLVLAAPQTHLDGAGLFLAHPLAQRFLRGHVGDLDRDAVLTVQSRLDRDSPQSAKARDQALLNYENTYICVNAAANAGD